MEGDFRNTLIIISAVVIAAIFIHGFITIRKNKNPYKLKTSNEKVEPIERGFDGSGFDQDGVSKVRVVGSATGDDYSKKGNSAQRDVAVKSNSSSTEPKQKIEPSYIPTRNTEHELDESIDNADTFDYAAGEHTRSGHIAPEINAESSIKAAQQDIGLTALGLNNPHIDADEIPNNKPFTADIGDDIADFDYGVSESGVNASGVNESNVNASNVNEGIISNHNNSSHTPKTPVTPEPKIEQPPVYQTPITQEKPKNTQAKNTRTTAKKKPITKKEAIKRNQIELNFGEPLHEDDMPSMSAIDDNNSMPSLSSTSSKNIERPTVEPEVLAISIVMPEEEVISGAALLPTLLTLGLRYGEMDIFHRHEDNAGNGEVTFSLANVVNPGTFNLDELENFSTRGVTLFMTLPNAGDPFEVFQHMLNAAKQISIEFGAQLLDDKRSVMTKQTEQHYTSKIREFERKNRIALA